LKVANCKIQEKADSINQYFAKRNLNRS